MQCSAWRPDRVGQHAACARCRAARGGTSCGPSPSCDAGPRRRCRGSSARRSTSGAAAAGTPRGPPGRHDLLDAHHGDQRLGQGQAHPAVALGLHDDQRAGLGDGEVGAGDARPSPQELAPQVRPGGLGELRAARRSASGCRVRPSRAGRSPGSRRGCGGSPGTRMCDGRSCPSWTISSARSVS